MEIPGLTQALKNAQAALLAEREPEGYWIGELSSSALSTATAVQALHLVDAGEHAKQIQAGIGWLIEHQNDDGGWGDTTISFSNISTTLLVWSALGLAGEPAQIAAAEARAEQWIEGYVGSLNSEDITKAVSDRYGKDRTFSVPILMMCALAGRLGEPHSAWQRVMALPFEIATMPRSWFGTLRLPVVSYALPALIAIGHARHHHAPAMWPLAALRRKAWPKASRVLAEIQPESGGYLEATPLTSFVTMALAGSEQVRHPVIPKAVGFLKDSMRADGSWPIDTDLATWGTTLATKALTGAASFAAKDREQVLGWLLNQQYEEVHPFTDAAPGGWAWTDLPGGVPDADDTPGALLALKVLSDGGEDVLSAAQAGVRWLLDLQNRDGGMPTFCRGWGALPFDRSSPDLTAHAMRALAIWRDDLDPSLHDDIDRSITKGLAYLKREQSFSGAWTPLWFGNQHLAAENNQAYGTAMVLQALSAPGIAERSGVDAMSQSAREWLLAAANSDGGWGGGEAGQSPSSIEETALVVEALAAGERSASIDTAIQAGTEWLLDVTKSGTHFPVTPIGFYFAKLWYHERLYPMVWATSALNRVAALKPAS